jgi:hypothetical protein
VSGFVWDAPFWGLGMVRCYRVGMLQVSVTPQTVFWVLGQLFEAQLSPTDTRKCG